MSMVKKIFNYSYCSRTIHIVPELFIIININTRLSGQIQFRFVIKYIIKTMIFNKI